MKLNGWQRLWLLVTVIWAIPWAVLIFADMQSGGDVGLASLAFWLSGWIIPSLALYALGLGVAWVIRGFLHAR